MAERSPAFSSKSEKTETFRSVTSDGKTRRVRETKTVKRTLADVRSILKHISGATLL